MTDTAASAPAPARLPPKRQKTPVRRALLRLLYLLPGLLAWVLQVRFIRISVPQRIGHLVLEPDCYLKDRAMAGRREIAVIALTREEVANQALLDHWRAHFTIVQHPLAVALLRPFLLLSFIRRDLAPYAVALNDTAEAYATYARWGNRPPILKLTEAERAAGRTVLARLGVPEDAWFVCVHSREGGYSPGDEHLHSYRNSAIADYVPAIQAIVAAGGWCIRMGDPTMRPLDPMPGVIDYALSAEKSAEMDLFLCAECRFLLGNSSGLYILATAFGRPCALANQGPLSATYGLGIEDIAIPKLLRRDGQTLPLGPLFASPASNYRYTWQYEGERLQVVDNSPAEILALAEEMLERLEGRAAYSAEDEARQAAFRALFTRGHYSFGAASRIGRDFLRALDDPAIRSA